MSQRSSDNGGRNVPSCAALLFNLYTKSSTPAGIALTRDGLPSHTTISDNQTGYIRYFSNRDNLRSAIVLNHSYKITYGISGG